MPRFLLFVPLTIALFIPIYSSTPYAIEPIPSTSLTQPAQGERSFSPPISVKKVIDGDTIELSTGVHVRYLGVDTPEMRKKVSGRWIIVNEPFAQEAYELNQSLVGGREIQLELDQEHRDRYGRLLAYVYTHSKDSGSMKFVNAELLRAGLARVMLRPPNEQYAALFHEIERDARANHRGLWRD